VSDEGSKSGCTPIPQALVRLSGDVDETMLRDFHTQMDGLLAGPDPILLELTTTGGDADVGRRIADDIAAMRSRTKRRLIFLGKTVVYSAGVSIMAGFDRSERWLLRGTMLLIHGRALTRTLNIDGPLVAERARVERLLADIDAGLILEQAGFRTLIEGSEVGLSEIAERVQTNWYLTAEEALARRLIERVI
jgi:ATP-dependent protease ClpP protease subunit